MNLFKRLVIAFFPKEITNNNINPANMFVSFISTKDFFSIINRKIVEHYKTNLFDISLEPLEVQIGGNNKIKFNKNEINNYYAYASVANIVGYKFYNLSNLSCCMTLANALLIKDIFTKYDERYYTVYLFSIYLLPYIFSSGIKQFPFPFDNEENKQRNYNWLAELSFSFFKTGFEKKEEKAILEEIKQELLSHPYLFFILQEFLRITENILFLNKRKNNPKEDRNFLAWISNQPHEQTQALTKREHNPHSTTFTKAELYYLDQVFPNDILPKYLFNDTDSFLITKTILSEIYDKKTIETFAKEIRMGKGNILDLIEYSTNDQLFKKGFFKGGKKYTSEFFYSIDADPLAEDIDEIISEIGENGEGRERFEIPERLKQESRIMEKFLNFYITIIAGFSTEKSDSFYLRTFNPKLIREISNKTLTPPQNNYSVIFWEKYQNLYMTTTQYYKNIYEGIKNNKKKILLKYDLHAEEKQLRGDLFLLLQENFIATLLQEVNPKNNKLYIKNPKLITVFQEKFKHSIQEIIEQENKKDLIHLLYKEVSSLLKSPENLIKPLEENFNEKNIFNLKENIYTLDFWIRRKFLAQLKNTKIQHCDDNVILGISAIARETLFGILLLLQFIKKEKNNIITIERLVLMYCYHILCLDGFLAEQTAKTIISIAEEFDDILGKRLHLDDNKEYLTIIQKAIQKEFIDAKQDPIMNYETIYRFKGVFQTITSYNRRALIPK